MKSRVRTRAVGLSRALKEFVRIPDPLTEKYKHTSLPVRVYARSMIGDRVVSRAGSPVCGRCDAPRPPFSIHYQILRIFARILIATLGSSCVFCPVETLILDRCAVECQRHYGRDFGLHFCIATA